MLQEPELKNARMAVGKNQKDVDRDRLVAALKSSISQKNGVAIEFQHDYFMTYPIVSTFKDKIQLYFQTDLFRICCKKVAPEDVKMRYAMLRPPFGVITNGTNALPDDEKNGFLLPPRNIAPPDAPLELTQLMRRAVLYSYNTTSKIFMTQICLTKKYGEFKSVADFERARHFLNINFSASGGEISFELFNYELWVSRGKLQSPIPFENCYFAVLNKERNGLTYNRKVYKQAIPVVSSFKNSPPFTQLVEGIQAPGGVPDPSPVGVVDRTPVAGDGVLIKNTTAETIAVKTDVSKLNHLFGSLEESVVATTFVPVETSLASTRARGRGRPSISRFGEMLIGEPLRQAVSVYGGSKHLTKKRVGASSPLLLFTKCNRNRNRNQSLKQKKQTIKKELRKKRKSEGKKKKSLKKS
jgi:hypothetical protein